MSITEIDVIDEIEIDDAPAGTLSPTLQSIARNYLAVRQRAGQAILESARYLAEARAAARYGEWGVFLEATGTQEDTATRMLAIAERADTDPQYARAISDGRLALTAAYEILSAPTETQQQALESATPTPPSVIRKAKQESKLRTSAELPDPDLPINYTIVWQRLGDHGVKLTHTTRNGVLLFSWQERADTPTQTPDWQYIENRLSLLEDGMEDAPPPPPATPPSAQRDLTALDTILPDDLHKAGYYWHSATPPTLAQNGSGWRGEAPTVATAIDQARLRMDAKGAPITIFPALSPMECKALIRETKLFIAKGADRFFPTIGKALRIAARMADEATE